MLFELKLRKVGNSMSVVFPKEFGDFLVWRKGDRNSSFIYFDPGTDSLALQDFDEGCAVGGFLPSKER
ncbi:MAG: hypothetical protein JWM99_2179 [Verrucomicrobiales bacterium]|nr:hypothetical protein [Verrucomicrobiales bacterium]